MLKAILSNANKLKAGGKCLEKINKSKLKLALTAMDDVNYALNEYQKDSDFIAGFKY